MKTKTRFMTAAGAAITLAFALFATTPASAQVDFSGKTVTIVVPFKEGGSTDVMARLFQGYFSKHLPGNPKVQVLNQPGGGSTKGANYFEREAETDGLTVIALSTSTLIQQILGAGKAKYDVAAWEPVYVVPQDAVFYANPATGVMGKDLGDDILALRKSGVVTGLKNATASELRTLITMELFGIENVKPVLGLGSGDQRKALTRGELNVNYDTAGAFNKKVKKLAADGKVIPFMTMGIPQSDGSVVNSGVFPDLPTALDGYKKLNDGKSPSGPIYDAWKNFTTMGVSVSKGMALPKGTPDEIQAVWVATLDKILADPDFEDKGRKIMGAYPFTTGDDAKELYKSALSFSPEAREWLSTYIMDKFGVKI